MSTSNSQSRLSSIVIEPYIFLMSLSIGLSLGPQDQLFQDKICLLEFNQTVEYCLKMAESETTDTKLAILARFNNLNQYKTIVDTVPAVLWVLIVGSVCDKFPRTRKPVMISCIFSGLVRDAILLLNLVYFYEWDTTILLFSGAVPTFVGSWWAGFTLSLAYIATHSNESNRVVRYLTFESALAAAGATGRLIAGQMLNHPSWMGGSEIRNFSGNYLLGIACSIVCIVWTLFQVDFERGTNAKTSTDANANTSEAELVINNNNDGEKAELVSKRRTFSWEEILNPKHVIASFQTVIRKRDTPGVRTQILLLFGAYIAFNFEKSGMERIIFPFTQRLYKWTFEIFSYNSVITAVAGPLVTMTVIPLLVKVLHLNDMEIAIVGILSLLLAALSVGSIITPIGYYLSLSFGSLSNAAAIGIRAKLSKIIGDNEVTQIFSAASSIEVCLPFFAVLLYTNVFNATLKYFPTLIMQMSAVILFIPLIHFIIVDLKFR